MSEPQDVFEILDGLSSPSADEVYSAVDQYDTRPVVAAVGAKAVSSGGGGSQPGVLLSKSYLFTEEATAGTYTIAHAIEAGTFLLEIATYYLGSPWAADTAELTIGDTAFPDGYVTAFDLTAPTQWDPTDPNENFVGQGVDDLSTFASSGAPFFNALNAIGEGGQSPGVYYPNADTLTIEVVTTIAVPPVVASGILLARVFYSTPVVAVAAAFA